MAATLDRDERRAATAFAAIVLSLCAAVLAIPYLGEADADAAERDMGEFDYYTLRVAFALLEPSQVSFVEWDFGDGSPIETVQITESNPNGRTSYHDFPSTGDYKITATLRNQYTDPADGQLKDGRAVMHITAHILGYPEITFDTHGGSDVVPIVGTKASYVAAEPAAPTRDGWTFRGWFTDEGCTRPYNWSSEVTKHITLHAGWSEVAGVVYRDVSYDAAGGTADRRSDRIRDGDAVVLPGATRDGYSFDGWFLGDEFFGHAGECRTVTEDLRLTARWSDGSGDGIDPILILLAVLAAICIAAYVMIDHFALIGGAAVCGILAVLRLMGVFR